MQKETREKLEAIIETEIENMPYKYRDLRNMFLYSMGYAKMSEQEIDEIFTDYGIEISQEAKDWALAETVFDN